MRKKHIPNKFKFLGITLMFFLFASYIKISAIDNPYQAGDTLDPACLPGEVNCTVEIGTSQWTTLGNDIYYNLGNIGIGTSSPTAKFHLPAGTATAGTAPLKLTAGTLLTTPETGAIEYDGTHYYGTIGSTRYQLDQQGGGATNINGLSDAISDSSSVFLGTGSGVVDDGTSNLNTGIGIGSLNANTSGNNNSAVGYQALYSNTSGQMNTVNGTQSLYLNTTGSYNTATGYSSLRFNTTGSNNTANGYYSLLYNTAGYGNTAMGEYSLFSNTTGSYNEAIGSTSLYSLVDGVYNTAIGTNAGDATSTGYNTTSDYSIYLGNNTKALSDNDQNEIVIGYNTTGNGSNTATIGNSSLLRTYLTGLNLKAGTATAGTSPLKFTAGTLLTTPETGAIEYDGTHYYGTIGSTRYQLDQQGGAYTFGNGLTETGGVVELGGNLNSGTTTIGEYPGISLEFYNESDYGGMYLDAGPLGNRSMLSLDGGDTWAYSELASRGNNNSAFYSAIYLEAEEWTPGTTKQTFDLYSKNNSTITNRVGVYGSAETTGGVDSRLLKFSSQSGSDILEIIVPDVISITGSKYMPLSVNGNFADATGNITISGGGATNIDGLSDGINDLSNIYLGTNSGIVDDGGDNQNVAVGNGALQANTSGGWNVAVGYQALKVNVGGWQNVAIGHTALDASINADYNTAIGNYALTSTTTGENNTSVGYNSMTANTTGQFNTANGSTALTSNTTGSYNTSLGYSSLLQNTTGGYNISIGSNSLSNNRTGSRGIAIGSDAMLYANSTLTAWTNSNIAIGYQSMRGSTTASSNTGNNNTALGYQSLYSYTSGGSNVALGYQSLYTNTTGGSNTSIGSWAMQNNTIGADNTAVGSQAFLSNTTGNRNSVLGYAALSSNSSGSYNTALGFQSLRFNTTGTYNIGLGYEAGNYISGGVTQNLTSDYSIYIGSSAKALADDGQNEIVIGYNAIGNGSNTATIGDTNLLRTYLTGVNLKAGTAIAGTAPLKFTAGTNLTTPEAGALEFDGTHFYGTIGSTRYQLDQQGGGGATDINGLSDAIYDGSSLFLGTSSGTNDDGANLNVGVGHQALSNNTTGVANMAIGHQSLFSNTIGGSNTASGFQSLASNTIGTSNTANGKGSLYYNIDGNYNSAFGDGSLYYNTSGNENTATGAYSLYSNTTGNYNTAFGSNALTSNITASNNTAVGYSSLLDNITGANNIAIGSNSFYSNKAGSNGIAIGSDAMYYVNNTSTAWTNYNIAIGYQSMRGSTTPANNTGNQNTALGYQSLYSYTSGWNNVAIGFEALYLNTTGYSSVAVGKGSLRSNTTGEINTAIGIDSLYDNTTGYYNTAVGFEALYSNITGYENTAVGFDSLIYNETGHSNTATGYNSLMYNETGNYNTAIGYEAGMYIANGVTALSAVSTSLFIGAETKALANSGTNEIVIGHNTVGNDSNTTTIGTGNVLYIGGASITGKAARFRNSAGYCDINPLTTSLTCTSDINLKKNIVNLENQEFILNENLDVSDSVLNNILTLTPVLYNWKTEDDTDSKHVGFIAQEMEQVFPDIVMTDSETDTKSIAYSNLIPYTIKAIQELDLKVEEMSLSFNNNNYIIDLIKESFENELNWFNKIFVKTVVTEGIEMKDTATGEFYCVTISNGEFEKVLGRCEEIDNEESVSSENTDDIVDKDISDTTEFESEENIEEGSVEPEDTNTESEQETEVQDESEPEGTQSQEPENTSSGDEGAEAGTTTESVI